VGSLEESPAGSVFKTTPDKEKQSRKRKAGREDARDGDAEGGESIAKVMQVVKTRRQKEKEKADAEAEVEASRTRDANISPRRKLRARK
jgi:hypothetical protein